MNPVLVVLQKELLDALRDRRALMALVIFPVMGPLLIWFLFTKIITISEDSTTVELPVAGVDFAPDLIDFLQQNGVRIRALNLSAAVDPASGLAVGPVLAAGIAAREYDYALEIPPDFQTLVTASQTVDLELHYDSSRTSAAGKVSRVASLLDAWSRETSALRLIVRGINPALMRPLNVSRIDVASVQARAQSLLAMIPMFVIMAAFMSGVGIAVDATAGERERKSLEPLLVNSVRRSQLIIGKWLAAAVFSVLGLVVVMSLNLYTLSKVPLESLGITFLIGPREIAGILLVTLPLAFFATSLQIFIGIFAKSFKDAQVYIGLLSLLPVLPYFYNIFNTNGRELWMSFVPMLGQNMLLADVLSGRAPGLPDLALAAVTLLVFSSLFVALATRLLRQERLLFS